MVTTSYGVLVHTDFSADTERQMGLSRVWAELQMATIGRAAALLKAGIIDAWPERLLDRVDEILAHPELRILEQSQASGKEGFGKYGENVKVLREKATVFKRKLEQRLEPITALQIPTTVLHNDLFHVICAGIVLPAG